MIKWGVRIAAAGCTEDWETILRLEREQEEREKNVWLMSIVSQIGEESEREQEEEREE